MSRTQDSIEFKSRPVFVAPLAFVLLFALGIGPNLWLVMLSWLILVAGVHLLWRPGEPQILLFLFAYQWLQIVSTLIYANMKGVPVSDLLNGFPAMDQAAIFGLFALAVLAIGMRWGAGPYRPFHLARARAAIARIPPARWLHLHVVMWVVAIVSTLLASAIPSLSQAFLALAIFKWATFTILTIVTFSRRDASRIVWFAIFLVEFLSSIGGYFSTFKSVFIFTLIALTMTSDRVTIRQTVGGVITAVAMLILGVYWTAIKTDYREFISGGQQSQVVVVSPVQAFDKIVDLLENVDAQALSRASESLAARFSELDMFSAVLVTVPDVVPHEWGALWWDSITRPFMPRIFFPDKPVIDESELSRRYTNLKLAGMDEGTQISMGYIAESYIDFSDLGMWGALLLFGYCIGRIYRWYVAHPNGQGILGFGLACASLLQVGSIGVSSSKLVGGVLVCVLVSAFLLNFIAPKYLRWIRT